MQKIEEKTLKFQKLVLDKADPKYKPLFSEFIEYWTEPNKTGTRIRYDEQKFFDVNKRLSTFAKNQKHETSPLKVVYTQVKHHTANKLEEIGIDHLTQAYNGEREGRYVHFKYFQVYDFLSKKGVIPNGKDRPYTDAEKAYFVKVAKIAETLVYGSLMDKLKKADGEYKQQIEQRIQALNQGENKEVEPQAKVIVLTDMFNKYSLEELLNKIKEK